MIEGTYRRQTSAKSRALQSGNRVQQSPPELTTYRTADEIVRSILDDHASPSSEISPSGELYRAIERFHTRRQHSPRRDLVQSHLDRWSSTSATGSPPIASSGSASMSSNQRASNSGNRRRFSREPQAAASPYPPRSLPPLRSLNNSRRPLTMSASESSNPSGYRGWRRAAERYSDRGRTTGRLASSEQFSRASQVQSDYNTQQVILQENQDSPRRRYPPPRNQRSLDDEYAQLDHANSQLRSLLDFTNTASQLYSELSFPSPPLQSYEPTEETRRVKRRKLDSDRLSSGFQGFSYGRFGQVESGPLTMEIVRCDGGNFSDDGQNYAAENILKDDGTVYCTKGPRCNIVLRHQGTTCFTLKELVIKAPRSEYTSPVQEGMVFIAMQDDELFTRTARYQIQYLPYTDLSRQTRGAEPLIVSIRHNDDPLMTRAQIRARRLYNIGVDDEDNTYRLPQIPSDFSILPSPFRVTTECSDDEVDDAATASRWRAPNRIGSLPFESDSSDDDEGNLDDISGIGYRRRRLRQISSEESEEEPDPEPDPAMAHQESHVDGERLLAPHARFFIERDKSKCTIRFDPPVSGRFILLKMWSSHRDPKAANIDIQAVVAKGFAGPRYFPDIELR